MELLVQPKTIYEGKIRITDVRAAPGDSAFLIDGELYYQVQHFRKIKEVHTDLW